MFSDIFPYRLPICMRYGDNQLITAASNFGGYTYRANSAFDPDQTGVGAQPNYWDQLSALYQYYRIVRCRYRITATCRTGTGGLLCVCPSTATAHATVGSAQVAAGVPLATKLAAFGAAGAPPAIVSGVVRIGQVYGMSDQQVMSDPNFRAAISANIGNSVYLAICVDTAGATDTVEIGVELHMEGYMEERTFQGQS